MTETHVLPERAKPKKTRRRREHGQAMVELALTAPVLVVLLLGLVEIGNGMNSYLTLVAAARDAARLGAQGVANDTDLRNLVAIETARLSGTVPTACVSGSAGICIARGSAPAPSAIRVDVCYDHNLIIGIPGILNGPLRMCSQTTMRVLS